MSELSSPVLVDRISIIKIHCGTHDFMLLHFFLVKFPLPPEKVVNQSKIVWRQSPSIHLRPMHVNRASAWVTDSLKHGWSLASQSRWTSLGPNSQQLGFGKL